MNRNKYIGRISRYILGTLLLGGLTLTSCSKTDNDIFEDNPVVRLDKKKQEIKDKLIDSDNGWIVTFSPDGGKYLGEFNLWYQFNPDGTILEKSDLDLNDLNVAVAEYNFVILKTVALNFPLGSKIHEFTAMGPEDLRTDIEFNFVDFIDDDTIEFEGHMTDQKVYLRKASLQDKQFVFSNKWSIYNKIDSVKKSIVTVNGKSVNYKWGNLVGWRSAQIGDSNTGYLTETSVVTFHAAEDGKSVKLVPALVLSDGSTIDKLDLVGNNFIGMSDTNGIITLTP